MHRVFMLHWISFSLFVLNVCVNLVQFGVFAREISPLFSPEIMHGALF
jgi:hypothetical protein